MSKKEKTIYELAKEFPQKTYAELERYRNEDRQQEAGTCITGEMRKDREEMKENLSISFHADLVEDIDRFHKKFGFEKNNKVGIPDNPELINFRTSFLMEELSEYTNAIVKKDTAGALDALVDIVYIALGTAWLFNLPFDKAWKEIQAANMKKVRAKDKTGKRGTKFDVIKPKGFIEPNIERIIEEEREWNDEKNSDNRL